MGGINIAFNRLQSWLTSHIIYVESASGSRQLVIEKTRKMLFFTSFCSTLACTIPQICQFWVYVLVKIRVPSVCLSVCLCVRLSMWSSHVCRAYKYSYWIPMYVESNLAQPWISEAITISYAIRYHTTPGTLWITWANIAKKDCRGILHVVVLLTTYSNPTAAVWIGPPLLLLQKSKVDTLLGVENPQQWSPYWLVTEKSMCQNSSKSWHLSKNALKAVTFQISHGLDIF